MFQTKEESGDLHLAVSDDDMFGSSGDESYKEPSPKRPRSDKLSSQPQEVNVSTSSNNSNQLESQQQPQIGNQGTSICTSSQSAITAANMSSDVKRVSDSSFEGLSPQVDPPDLATTDYNRSHDEPVDYDAKTPLKQISPHTAERNNSTRRSLSSSFMEKTENVPFNKHHSKLSADLISLSKSAVSSVIEIRKGSEILYAHGCVFKVRCPSLFNELTKNSDCLDEFSLEVCHAVFGFIYAGDVGKAQALEMADKNQLLECCLRFGLEELAEELFPKDAEDKYVSSPVRANLFLADQPGKEATAEGTDHNCIEEALPYRTPKREKVVGDVIVLDSDGYSAEDVLNSEAASENAFEDELDLYLNRSIRFLEKTISTPSGISAGVDDERGSPPKTTSTLPKRSIDKYFQDSFPSMDGLSVTPTPSGKSLQQTKGPTPCSSRGINNCVTPGGQLVVSELATPIPDYESMVSPDLKVHT